MATHLPSPRTIEQVAFPRASHKNTQSFLQPRETYWLTLKGAYREKQVYISYFKHLHCFKINTSPKLAPVPSLLHLPGKHALFSSSNRDSGAGGAAARTCRRSAGSPGCLPPHWCPTDLGGNLEAECARTSGTSQGRQNKPGDSVFSAQFRLDSRKPSVYMIFQLLMKREKNADTSVRH